MMFSQADELNRLGECEARAAAAVNLDFNEAFNTISHNIHIDKLTKHVRQLQ